MFASAAFLALQSAALTAQPYHWMPVPQSPPNLVMTLASWYGEDFHGKQTASGAPFDKYDTRNAATKIPELFGTCALVTNLDNRRSVTVCFKDKMAQGKYRNRGVDLSEAAAKQLGYKRAGITAVAVEVLYPLEER